MDFGKLSWAFEPGLLRAPRRRAAAMTEQLGPFTPCMGVGLAILAMAAQESVIILVHMTSNIFIILS
jgi:hypothetical protein